MDPFDETAARALADVRPGARWPWLTLAAGVAIVAAGTFVFSPDQPTAVDQPASLAGSAAP